MIDFKFGTTSKKFTKNLAIFSQIIPSKDICLKITLVKVQQSKINFEKEFDIF